MSADVATGGELVPEIAEKTSVYKWLSAHCSEYGFIVRFPKGKTDITGIMYEPWHFRYVGIDAAKYIMQKGITLEEYITELNAQRQELQRQYDAIK